MGLTPLPTISLRYNGIWDFDGMYTAIIDWAKNYNYLWHEQDFKHKVPSPAGAEQEFKWFLKKKVNESIDFVILITVHMWDITEVEVDAGGVKKTLTSGRLYINMNGQIHDDRQKMWKGSKFRKKLGEWYDSIIDPIGMGGQWDALYYRMHNLHAIIKNYFDMQTKKYAYEGQLGEN